LLTGFRIAQSHCHQQQQQHRFVIQCCVSQCSNQKNRLLSANAAQQRHNVGFVRRDG
jgi:hypothetical protein